MCRNNFGVTTMSLIIIIIAIIILASISFYLSFDTPNRAVLSDFLSEVNDIKVSVATYRAENAVLYDENKDFIKVVVKNAPDKFVSFSSNSGDTIGYAIDLNVLDYKGAKRGTKKIINGEVEFGVDDVYIYDKNGTVYYVRGFDFDDKLYYNTNLSVEK